MNPNDAKTQEPGIAPSATGAARLLGEHFHRSSVQTGKHYSNITRYVADTSPFYEVIALKVEDCSIGGARLGDDLFICVSCHGHFLDHVVVQRSIAKPLKWVQECIANGSFRDQSEEGDPLFGLVLVEADVGENLQVGDYVSVVIDGGNEPEVYLMRSISLTIAALFELMANGSLTHAFSHRTSLRLIP